MEIRRAPATAPLGTQATMGPAPANSKEVVEPSAADKALAEENRHSAHAVHTGVDVAKLAKEAPEIAEHLLKIVAENPRLDSSAVRALVELAHDAPDLAKTLAKTIADHPMLGKPIMAAMPRIKATFAGVTAALKAEFPQLSAKAITRIAESSVGRGIAKAIPGVGVGIALWGTYDAAKALADPRLSMGTKARYATANLADWGAAVGGLLAETGVGEAAAIAAAVASIGLYAKAEASKEHDLEAEGHHGE